MNNSVHAMTRAECMSRLSSHDVGRVSVSVGALPVIVPVVYRVDGDSVIFRALLDETLAASCDQAVIAFEADGSGEPGCSAWSVMVTGVAFLLPRVDHQNRRRLLGLKVSRLSGLSKDGTRHGMQGPDRPRLAELPYATYPDR